MYEIHKNNIKYIELNINLKTIQKIYIFKKKKKWNYENIQDLDLIYKMFIIQKKKIYENKKKTFPIFQSDEKTRYFLIHWKEKMLVEYD